MTTSTPVYLSKKGLKELRKEIGKLEREQQSSLKSLRDLDKTDGREERLARIERLAQLESIESELADKKLLLTHAKRLPRRRDAIKVAIGSIVDLIDTKGRMVRYTLVDTFEANPTDGRISIKSPLGQSLIGKQIKDMVEWSAGLKTNRLRLVAIR